MLNSEILLIFAATSVIVADAKARSSPYSKLSSDYLRSWLFSSLLIIEPNAMLKSERKRTPPSSSSFMNEMSIHLLFFRSFLGLLFLVVFWKMVRITKKIFKGTWCFCKIKFSHQRVILSKALTNSKNSMLNNFLSLIFLGLPFEFHKEILGNQLAEKNQSDRSALHL